MKSMCLMVCSLFLLSVYSMPAFARDEKLVGPKVPGVFKTVKGFIQEVSHDNIKVLDKYYNIENATVKNKYGRIVDKGVLKRGAEVEIRLKDSVVTGVIFLRGYLHE
jgi:hypothetical protein